ncbi:MAG: hypothetical protein ACRDOK_06395 [Streptosporangiaceae bacterium]
MFAEATKRFDECAVFRTLRGVHQSPDRAHSPEYHLADALDLLAALLAIGVMILVASGHSGLPRLLLALGFAFFVPGRAIVTNWPQLARWSEAGAAIVLSLAITTLVATVALWLHQWRPLVLFYAEAALSLSGLTLGILRRQGLWLARSPARRPRARRRRRGNG